MLKKITALLKRPLTRALLSGLVVVVAVALAIVFIPRQSSGSELALGSGPSQTGVASPAGAASSSGVGVATARASGTGDPAPGASGNASDGLTAAGSAGSSGDPGTAAANGTASGGTGNGGASGSGSTTSTSGGSGSGTSGGSNSGGGSGSDSGSQPAQPAQPPQPTPQPPVAPPPPPPAVVHTVTLSIDVKTVLNNMGNVASAKKPYVPASGWILTPVVVNYTPGETVYDVLARTTQAYGIPMESMYNPMYGSRYIEGIGHIYEFDVGPLSGWMYKVNGWYPNYGSSQYALSDGDVIELRYTCDLGTDVGGSCTATGQCG